MEITYDPPKNQRNIDERGLPFDEAYYFDFQTALIKEDTRFPYPEKRYIALGRLYDRVHVLCFTPTENGIRVISFRKANKREVKQYEQAINQ